MTTEPVAPDAHTPEINSEPYWDHRFRVDWAALGGNHQTRSFMELVDRLLPAQVRGAITEERLSIVDWGCAEGDGVPVLERAFPGSEVTGIDISAVAIERARATHPASRFRRADLLAGDERTDVIVCSNVLEHFSDPQAVVEQLARRARRFVVVLVPFIEEPRIDEHEASFSHDSFPLELDDGKRLVHARTIDLRWRRRSPWPGMQLLAIYATDAHGATLADVNQSGPALRRRRDLQQLVERVARPPYRLARAAGRLLRGRTA